MSSEQGRQMERLHGPLFQGSFRTNLRSGYRFTTRLVSITTPFRRMLQK
jgi:hypothetical protein